MEKKEKGLLRRAVDSYGVPRLIITAFLLLMFLLAPFAQVNLWTQFTNVFNRFSWNAIMVLAMVPMIHWACPWPLSLAFWVRRCLLSWALREP